MEMMNISVFFLVKTFLFIYRYMYQHGPESVKLNDGNEAVVTAKDTTD